MQTITKVLWECRSRTSHICFIVELVYIISGFIIADTNGSINDTPKTSKNAPISVIKNRMPTFLSIALIVGLPKSLLEPIAHLTSINDSSLFSFALFNSFLKSMRLLTLTAFGYPSDFATPTKSAFLTGVGCPPTVSCASLFMTI